MISAGKFLRGSDLKGAAKIGVTPNADDFG